MFMEIEPYLLEKWIWTDEDFELMGWHDATIHAVGFAFGNWELAFDIDYILQWVKPIFPESCFYFWVSPATLVFENVSDIKFDIDVANWQEITLQDIERNNPKFHPHSAITEWEWLIDSHQGSISFHATGFKQFFRSSPIFGKDQSLIPSQRGGFSFSRDIPLQ